MSLLDSGGGACSSPVRVKWGTTDWTWYVAPSVVGLSVIRLPESSSNCTPPIPSTCWARNATGSQIDESVSMAKSWSTWFVCTVGPRSVGRLRRAAP